MLAAPATAAQLLDAEVLDAHRAHRDRVVHPTGPRQRPSAEAAARA
jgi:hypothetical protein